MVAGSRPENAGRKGTADHLGVGEGKRFTEEAGNAGWREGPLLVVSLERGRSGDGDEPTTADKIRDLQIKLIERRRTKPGFRFYQLYDKVVYRADIALLNDPKLAKSQ